MLLTMTDLNLIEQAFEVIVFDNNDITDKENTDYLLALLSLTKNTKAIDKELNKQLIDYLLQAVGDELSCIDIDRYFINELLYMIAELITEL